MSDFEGLVSLEEIARRVIERAVEIAAQELARELTKREAALKYDPLGVWLRDRTRIQSGGVERLADVYRNYVMWCEANKVGHLVRPKFLVQLRNRGFEGVGSSVKGIRLVRRS